MLRVRVLVFQKCWETLLNVTSRGGPVVKSLISVVRSLVSVVKSLLFEKCRGLLFLSARGVGGPVVQYFKGAATIC